MRGGDCHDVLPELREPISNSDSLKHGMGPVCYARHMAYQEALRKIAFNEPDNVIPIEEAKSA